MTLASWIAYGIVALNIVTGMMFSILAPPFPRHWRWMRYKILVIGVGLAVLAAPLPGWLGMARVLGIDPDLYALYVGVWCSFLAPIIMWQSADRRRKEQRGE